MTRPPTPIRLACVTLLAMVPVACANKPEPTENLETLDQELTGANTASTAKDPALATALQAPIMADRELSQSANRDAIRPPPRPDPGSVPPDFVRPDPTDQAMLRHVPTPSAICPECEAARGALTLGALAARQINGSIASCAAKITYSAAWANRLPRALPLYPDARLAEAAGTDRDGCALRIVSFASGAPISRVMDFYYTRATVAGYSAGHRADGLQHVLGGTRVSNAYIVYLSARHDGGTDVDLVCNGGT